jgi:hypothetical protein
MNGELSVLLSPGNYNLEVETIQFFNGFYSTHHSQLTTWY